MGVRDGAAGARGARLTVEEALAQLPAPGGERFATLLRHGTLLVDIFVPRGADTQQPHARDELYFVVQGRGTFSCDGRRHEFGPHDVLFVPAGVEHRFVEFTEDLVVWVVFYGPEGGEKP